MLDDPLVVSPLTFTVYHTPPRVVPRGSVLVQVWAAGLDGVDARIVGAGLQLVPAPATVLADAEEKGAPDGVGTDADVDALAEPEAEPDGNTPHRQHAIDTCSLVPRAARYDAHEERCVRPAWALTQPASHTRAAA